VLSAGLRAQRAIPETPVSQVLSLPSLGVPDHKQPIKFMPRPEREAMIEEVFTSTSSTQPVDDLPLDDLGLADKDEPKDNSTRM
jgi:hypothetical protein